MAVQSTGPVRVSPGAEGRRTGAVGLRRRPVFYGWVLVATAFVTMGIVVNARTAFSLFFPAILDEFGWSRGAHGGDLHDRPPRGEPVYSVPRASDGPTGAARPVPRGARAHEPRPRARDCCPRALAPPPDPGGAGGGRHRLGGLHGTLAAPAELVRASARPRARRRVLRRRSRLVPAPAVDPGAHRTRGLAGRLLDARRAARAGGAAAERAPSPAASGGAWSPSRRGRGASLRRSPRVGPRRGSRLGRHRVDPRTGRANESLLVALPLLFHGSLRLVRRPDPPDEVPPRSGVLGRAGRVRARPGRPDRNRRADRLGPPL